MERPPLTKQELAKRVASRLDKALALNEVIEIIETIVDEIRQANELDRNVIIRGFGIFKVIAIDQKVGRVVRTGERVLIPPHRKVKFKPYYKLSKIL